MVHLLLEEDLVHMVVMLAVVQILLEAVEVDMIMVV